MMRKFNTVLAVILAVLLTLVVVQVDPPLKRFTPVLLNLMPAAVCVVEKPELLLKLVPSPIKR